MRIAFVVGDISSSGGIERVTSILSRFLAERGLKITIISLFRAHVELQYEFSENVTITNLTDKNYAVKKAGGLSRLWMFVGILRKLRKYIKNNSFDILIGQGFPVSFILSLVGFRKKLIACEHVYYEYYNKLIQKLRIGIYKKNLHVVVLTASDLNSFKNYLNNISLISNPVLLNTKQTSDLSSQSIISVGRLETAKGYDMLLRASVKVFEKYPDWTLNIFGSGILETELRELQNLLGLNNNVFFKGSTKNIEKEYLSSSLYVLSSRFEGFGMVLIEAAACGLPIVAFDCPTGPRSILEDDKGILVPANDIDALSREIINMIESKEKRECYAQRGSSIIKHYEPNVICDEWEALLSKLKEKL